MAIKYKEKINTELLVKTNNPEVSYLDGRDKKEETLSDFL